MFSVKVMSAGPGYNSKWLEEENMQAMQAWKAGTGAWNLCTKCAKWGHCIERIVEKEIRSARVRIICGRIYTGTVEVNQSCALAGWNYGSFCTYRWLCANDFLINVWHVCVPYFEHHTEMLEMLMYSSRPRAWSIKSRTLLWGLLTRATIATAESI